MWKIHAHCQNDGTADHDNARKKLAEVVVDGKVLKIEAETIDYVMAQRQLAGAADVQTSMPSSGIEQG